MAHISSIYGSLVPETTRSEWRPQASPPTLPQAPSAVPFEHPRDTPDLDDIELKDSPASAEPVEDDEEAYETHSESGDLPKDEADVEKQVDVAPIPADQAARPPLAKTQSKASVNNVASIPNGGLQAWLQVLGAWTLFFNTWGIINTFGAYQTFYEGGTLFQSTSSNISWIGAVQAFLLMFVGGLTGPIYDAGHFRALLFSGSFFVVFGQMMLSLCTTYYQAFLAQAICIGGGAGLLFVPSVAIMSTYFSTKIAFAIGIAATGSSLGGVIYPIVFHRLQPTIGFAWASRVIGFMELATLLIPVTVMKVRVLPAKKRKLIDTAAFKDLPYVLYVIGGIIGFAGLYVPFFYIQYYSIVSGITNPNLGFYLLAILNSASVFGRVLPNLLADKLGGLNILVPCSIAASVLIFALIGVDNEAGIIVIAILYGFFSGTYVSLPPSIFVSLTPNRGLIGTRMGMGFAFVGIGVLTGTPIAGAILGENNFRGIWIFGGALTMGASGLFIAARVAKYGWNPTIKA